MANLSTTTTAINAMKVQANLIVTLATSMATASAASAATSPDDTACRSYIDGQTSRLTAVYNELVRFNQNLTVG